MPNTQENLPGVANLLELAPCPQGNDRTSDRTLDPRGREQAQIFTDDRNELLHAVSRPDDPMSATQLAESMPRKPTIRDRLAFARRLSLFAAQNDPIRAAAQDLAAHKELEHDR